MLDVEGPQTQIVHVCCGCARVCVCVCVGGRGGIVKQEDAMCQSFATFGPSVSFSIMLKTL
jgi:hypothetical protein